MPRPTTCLSFMLLLSLAATCARGQSAPPPSGDVSRVVRQFDFEERARGNVEDTPMDWVKLEGSGRPHYVNATLASDFAASGRYSFRFELNGGSLVYRYPHGKIRVHAGASYRVSGMVRTDPLPNARARISIHFCDEDGRPIAGSARHSTPFVSAGDAWTRMTLDGTAPEGSRWLEIELGLLQPALWRESSLGKDALFEQDITGRAWFDDLSVAQVPRVRLTTQRPGNIFRRSEPVVVRAQVNDRVTDDLTGQLLVVDAEDRVVYQRSGALEVGPRSPAGDRVAEIPVGDLPAGWYRASLRLTSRGIDVADESIQFIQLADNLSHLPPDPRFGVIATDLPFSSWPDLPALLPTIGAARVKLAVWDTDADIETAEGLDFPKLLQAFRELQITPTACLVAPPPRLAKTIGGSDWRRLLKAPPEAWQPQLSYLVSRYSGYLDRWQFGLDADAAQFVADDTLRKAYGLVHEQFSQLMQQPDLSMPWPAWYDLDAQVPAGVSLSVPPDVLPHQLPLYINDLARAGDRQQLAVSLQMLSRSEYGRQAQVRDFVQRIVYALSADAQRIDLPLPFDVRTTSDGSISTQPQESLLILRTVLATLGQSTYRGPVPLDEGVEAFLFERAGGEGVMLVWTKSPAGPARTIPLVLGNRPQRIDLLGNASAVLRPKDALGTTDVQVGSMPSFIVGIDARLARLRGSFAFDNPLVESSFQAHSRVLSFTNPYPGPISGRIRLTGPAGWTVTAQAAHFNLNPGETYRAPVSIEFPYNSVAGDKTVLATVQLQADTVQEIRVPVALRLGLGDVGLETMALRDGHDVIVQQMITNYTDRPVDYTAFVIFPGHARQERLLTGLRPGTTIIKKYRFANVATASPQTLRSGVKETDGTRVLNEEVAVQ